MKKIFFLLVTACSLVSCDPVHEDITNGSSITAEELKAMTSITTDSRNDSAGNVITCVSSAPVNVVWEIDGKTFTGSYASRKMSLPLGEKKFAVVVKGMCGNGKVVSYTDSILCQVTTQPLKKVWIYGEPGTGQDPFKPAGWNAACMRFSDNEGKFVDINDNEGNLPYLEDGVYWGKKTLIFDISNATPDCAGRIMNGWWSARYDGDQDVKFTNGLWELQLTDAIAKDCARGGGGNGKDLDIMVTSGSCQINAIYYEE